MAAIDLTFYSNFDGGDLSLGNDDLNTIEGLSNQVYLALVGGNIEQSTDPELSELEQRFDWWGNSLLQESNQFNSEFERIVNSVALNSEGLIAVETAVKKDLEYLKEFANITISADLIGIAKLQITVTIIEPDATSIKFKYIWDGTRNTLIYDSPNI